MGYELIVSLPSTVSHSSAAVVTVNVTSDAPPVISLFSILRALLGRAAQVAGLAASHTHRSVYVEGGQQGSLEHIKVPGTWTSDIGE